MADPPAPLPPSHVLHAFGTQCKEPEGGVKVCWGGGGADKFSCPGNQLGTTCLACCWKLLMGTEQVKRRRHGLMQRQASLEQCLLTKERGARGSSISLWVLVQLVICCHRVGFYSEKSA